MKYDRRIVLFMETVHRPGAASTVAHAGDAVNVL